MTQPTIGRDTWRLRTVPADLAALYRSEGWWTDATLGQVVADGLGAMGGAGFRVRSADNTLRQSELVMTDSSVR